MYIYGPGEEEFYENQKRREPWRTATIDRFPNIKKVALLMAYSNDMVSRYHPQEVFLETAENVISAEGVYEDDLQAFDAWLATLTDEEQETLADGEHTEMKAIAARCLVRGIDDMNMCELFTVMFEA